MATKAEIDRRDVDRALARIVPVTRDKIGDANQTSARDIATIAQTLVPVRTGTLRSFITSEYNPRTGTARVGIRRGTTTGPAGRPVNPATYGRIVHNGSVYLRGRPFMAQAAERGRAVQVAHAKAAGPEIARALHDEYMAAGGGRR